MANFLEEHGSTLIVFVTGTIVLVSLIIGVSISTMNGNQHYYDGMEKCINAKGTWIPQHNVGICLVNNV